MKRRSQPRVKGGRQGLPSSVTKRIWNEVDKMARKFQCSRSFVIATALADAMGVEIESRYDDGEGK